MRPGPRFIIARVPRNTLSIPYGSVASARERLAARSPSFLSLVAELDGRVVGQVGLELMRGRRRHLGVVGIMVHDDFTGRGIATALMIRMLDLADNWLNLRRLELQVYTDNEPAIALYKKFGFEIEGTLRDVAFGEGRYLDTFYMARIRPDAA